MAYKCKSCGYRFKPSDSDLCPECFTARDDISCLDAGGGESHNHFKDSAGGDDFIAQQMRDESKLSGDELLEQISGYTDSIRRGISRNEVPPNTYQRAPQVSFQSRPQQQPQPQRIAFTPQNVQQSYYGAKTMDTAGTKSRKKGSGCGIFIVLAIIIAANSGVVKKIFDRTRDFFEADKELQQSEVREVESETVTEAPEVTAPPAPEAFLFVNDAGDIMDEFTFGSKSLGYDQPAMDYDAVRIDVAPALTEVVWYTVKCNITFSDSSKRAEDITLYGYNKGAELYSWQMNNDYGTGNKLFGVPLTFPRCERFELHISCVDGSGEKSTAIFEPDLVSVADELGFDDAGSMFKSNAYEYSYDYTQTSFDTNMTDINGSGYRVKLSGVPVDYESSGAQGSLSLEDDDLPTDDMKLCKVMVVTDDGKSPGDAEYYQTYIVGFDAKGTVSYVYNVNGSHEVPVSSRVQNYELCVIIIDEGGYAKELRYRFSSADLYATKS